MEIKGDVMEINSEYKQILKEISIEKIILPQNTRLNTEDRDIAELMSSIKSEGLLQPIRVEELPNEKYLLIFGNRRLIAIKKLGWKTVPAIVGFGKIDEVELFTKNLVENIQRQDINSYELGKACLFFKNRNFSVSEIATRLSVSKSKIIDSLTLVNASGVSEEQKRNIVFVKNSNQAKTEKMSMSNFKLAQKIIYSGGTTFEDSQKLLNYFRSESISSRDLRIIILLINKGESTENAIKCYKKYHILNPNILIKKEIFEKYLEEKNMIPSEFINFIIKKSKYKDIIY
jgi:ParB/RepB/Spo0J family partition protein